MNTLNLQSVLPIAHVQNPKAFGKRSDEKTERHTVNLRSCDPVMDWKLTEYRTHLHLPDFVRLMQDEVAQVRVELVGHVLLGPADGERAPVEERVRQRVP